MFFPLLIIIFYFIISLTDLLKLYIVDKWMSLESKIGDTLIPSSDDASIYFLIPVLNEQKIIYDTYYHFSNLIKAFPQNKIVFITTERESTESVSTKSIIEKLMIEHPNNQIELIHYPYKEGVMAHQLNFAISSIRATEGKKSDSLWFAVYNADSRIDAHTVNYVYSTLRNQPSDQDYCFQQYSFFVRPTQKKKSVIGSASLWQCRWSLIFEIFRVLFNEKLFEITSKWGENILRNVVELLFEKMNYVIGHGLYISNTALKKVGDFPENTINEDAFLGLKLNSKKIPIKAIPILERADFAPNVKVYIKQQTVWFNGPLYAFHYYSLYKKFCLSRYEKIRLLILSFKLFLHAVYWILAPLVFLIPLLTSNGNKAVYISWLLIAIFHLPVFHFFVKKMISKNCSPSEAISNASIVHCLIFYFVHCIGPIRGLILKATGRNNMDDKYKTERL